MVQPVNAPTLSTLILAGGRSLRMGRDKALLTLGDRPLIHHLYSVARHCSDAIVIMTPWPERYRPLLPSSAQFIREPPPDGQPPGPLAAFVQALPQLHTDWILLLACDLPNLAGPTLQHWASQLAILDAKTLAYLPEGPKGWEPLCGFYRCTCLAPLTLALHQGHRSFQAGLAALPVQAIPDAPPEQLFNCNTPEQWKQAVGDSS
ncbi:MAG: molybdenum cofactor guanylyltransferase [Leptolyngbyaceae cyanobacterium]